MISLGLWLLVVGVLDLFRARADHSRRLLLGVLLAVLAVLALPLALYTEGSGAQRLCLATTTLIGGAAWIMGSALALDRHSALARGTAFAGLGLGLAGALLTDSLTLRTPSRSVFMHFGDATVIAVVGVLVFQVASANILVRLILDSVGVPAADNEQRLREVECWAPWSGFSSSVWAWPAA